MWKWPPAGFPLQSSRLTLDCRPCLWVVQAAEGYLYTWMVYDSSNSLTSAPLYGSEVNLMLSATGRYGTQSLRTYTKKGGCPVFIC